MNVIYEVIYLMKSEKAKIHRKMTQKELAVLLQDINIELISVNDNKVIYKRR